MILNAQLSLGEREIEGELLLLLLLLLSRFSHVRLCATPETAAHQAPPSLGLSIDSLFDLKDQLNISIASRIV